MKQILWWQRGPKKWLKKISYQLTFYYYLFSLVFQLFLFFILLIPILTKEFIYLYILKSQTFIASQITISFVLIYLLIFQSQQKNCPQEASPQLPSLSRRSIPTPTPAPTPIIKVNELIMEKYSIPLENKEKELEKINSYLKLQPEHYQLLINQTILDQYLKKNDEILQNLEKIKEKKYLLGEKEV